VGNGRPLNGAVGEAIYRHKPRTAIKDYGIAVNHGFRLGSDAITIRIVARLAEGYREGIFIVNAYGIAGKPGITATIDLVSNGATGNCPTGYLHFEGNSCWI
jgi:hypothetical protein